MDSDTASVIVLQILADQLRRIQNFKHDQVEARNSRDRLQTQVSSITKHAINSLDIAR